LLNSSSCPSYLRRWPLAIALLSILFIIACGAAASPTPDTTPAATPAEIAPTTIIEPTSEVNPNPTVTPQPTAAPSQSTPSGGTLNIGEKETGVFEAHPSLTSSPRIQFTNMTVGEGLVRIDKDLSAKPLLAESWDISPDFLTWTFTFSRKSSSIKAMER
jgi:ABC-type transport system substrate-binding protein